MKLSKIKFSDIAGMLDRDQMKEIIGGSGGGSGDYTYNGGTLNTVYVGGGGGGGSSYSSPSFLSYYNNLASSYNSNTNNSSTTNSYSNYGGGGGSATQPGTHSLPLSNLPVGNGTNTQVANFCVFRNMEVVEKYFSKSVSQGSFVLQYWQQHPNENPAQTGFKGTTAELTSFINANFNTIACTNINSIISAINSDQPVLAFLTNSVLANGTIDGHEVTITGYNASTNLFTFYNSVTDKYETKPGSAFSGALAVTGAKN